MPLCEKRFIHNLTEINDDIKKLIVGSYVASIISEINSISGIHTNDLKEWFKEQQTKKESKKKNDIKGLDHPNDETTLELLNSIKSTEKNNSYRMIDEFNYNTSLINNMIDAKKDAIRNSIEKSKNTIINNLNTAISTNDTEHINQLVDKYNKEKTYYTKLASSAEKEWLEKLTEDFKNGDKLTQYEHINQHNRANRKETPFKTTDKDHNHNDDLSSHESSLRLDGEPWVGNMFTPQKKSDTKTMNTTTNTTAYKDILDKSGDDYWKSGNINPKKSRKNKKEFNMFDSSSDSNSDDDKLAPYKKLKTDQDSSYTKKIIEEKTQQDEDKGKGR